MKRAEDWIREHFPSMVQAGAIYKNTLKHYREIQRDAAKGSDQPELDGLPQGSDAWTNQRVLFCGHKGWFPADVFITPYAVAVTGNGPYRVAGDTLKRTELETAQWHITDAHGGYWGPNHAMFLLPRKALTQITDENRASFL